jgi:hypothetical protein
MSTTIKAEYTTQAQPLKASAAKIAAYQGGQEVKRSNSEDFLKMAIEGTLEHFRSQENSDASENKKKSTREETETAVNTAIMDQQREHFKATLQEVHDAMHSLVATVYEQVDQAMLFTLETCINRIKSIEWLLYDPDFNTNYLATCLPGSLKLLHAALKPYVQNGDPEEISGSGLSGIGEFINYGLKSILDELDGQEKMQTQE